MQELQYLEVGSCTENSKTYLDAMLLEFCHLPVHVLARVSYKEKLRLVLMLLALLVPTIGHVSVGVV